MTTSKQRRRRPAHDTTDRFYRRYRTRAIKVAMRLLRDEDDAHDAVQDAFMGALRHEHRLHELTDPYRWVYRSVTNACIDCLRKRGVAAAHADDPVLHHRVHPPVAGPSQACDASQIRAAIRQSIRELSNPHREVIVMREIEGLAYHEIARRCGRPRGTVMSRLFYAREHLRDLVGGRLELERGRLGCA